MEYDEGRSERLDLFDFLQHLSKSSTYLPGTGSRDHTTSHPTGVSSVSPNTYICGLNQSQEWFVCAQGLQGMTVNMQESLSLASGVEFVMVAKMGFQLPSFHLPPAAARQEQAASVS